MTKKTKKRKNLMYGPPTGPNEPIKEPDPLEDPIKEPKEPIEAEE